MQVLHLKNKIADSNMVQMWKDVFSKEEYGVARKNMILSGIMLTVSNCLTTGTFYTGFLLAMGIDIVNINLIGILTFVAGFFTFLSPMLLNRFKSRRKLLITLRLIVLLFNNIAITVLPFIPMSLHSKIALLCIFVFITSAVNTVVSPGFSAWHIEYMGDNQTRPRYLTLETIISAVVSSLMMLLSGQLANLATSLGGEAEITFIVILRLVGVIFVLLEIYFQTRPKEPEYHNTDGGTSVAAIFRDPFRYKKFMLTCVVIFLWDFSFYISYSGFATYLLDTLHLSYGTITAVGSLNVFGVLFLTPLWKRFMDHHSMAATLIVTMLIMNSSYLITLFFTPTNVGWMYPIMGILQHIINGGLGVALTNLQWMHLPEKDRTTCLSFSSFVRSICALFGQLFGTFIIASCADRKIGFFFLELDGVQFAMLMHASIIALIVCYIIVMRKKLKIDAKYQQKIS